MLVLDVDDGDTISNKVRTKDGNDGREEDDDDCCCWWLVVVDASMTAEEEASMMEGECKEEKKEWMKDECGKRDGFKYYKHMCKWHWWQTRKTRRTRSIVLPFGPGTLESCYTLALVETWSMFRRTCVHNTHMALCIFSCEHTKKQHSTIHATNIETVTICPPAPYYLCINHECISLYCHNESNIDV